MSTDKGEDVQEIQEVIQRSVLLLLPPEMWEIISEMVLEASFMEHQNLVNCSLFFQNLRASQRTTYLFEQVLPLVIKSVWENEDIGGFPVGDFLSCRAVCKEWNAVIDKTVHQFDPFQDVLRSFEVNDKFYFVKQNRFSWRERSENISVQDFMEHFEPTHDPSNTKKGRNPFIWGNVELDIRVPDDDDEEKLVAYHRYLEDFSSMLAKYGKHAHSFGLAIFKNVFEPLLLRDWLLYMPYLVRLKFLSDDDGEEIGEINLEDYQFPELRCLKKMFIRGLPPQVFNLLLGQNCHISVLHVENPKDTNVFTVALPNLKEFKTGCSPDDIVEILASQVQWPLETLELKRVRLVGCVPLFQVIQDKFANTLVYLGLEIIGQDAGGMEGSLWQDCKNFRLDLPKLKRIWLDLSTNPVCLDFLMPMKNSLEEILSLSDGLLPSQEVRRETSGRTIIQFKGFERKMLESNIWSIFNKLKKVVMIRDFGGRGGPHRCYLRKDWMLNNHMPDFSDSLRLIFLLPSTL